MQHWTLRLIARPGDLLYPLPALLLLWYALAGGQDWTFGIAAVLLAVASGRWLSAASVAPVSVPGLLRFSLYFLFRSIEGGADVAWRALHPRLPLVIREEWRPLDLHRDSARTLFLVTVSLLPGTLACRYADGHVYVHTISAGALGKLDELEARVRAVFAPQPDAGAES